MGYKSAAQRKAVWASKKDGGKGNPNRKKKTKSKVKRKNKKQMKGVPHFKKDGAIYRGATHKDAKGKLMSGKNHTKKSVYVYHINKLPKRSLTKAYKQAGLLK